MTTETNPPTRQRTARETYLLSKRAQLQPNSTYPKHGNSQQIQREADTINFIHQHTSIPVRSILSTFIDSDPHGESSYFTMTAIPGSSLTTVWSTMTPAAQDRAKAELRGYLQEMSSLIPSNPDFIGSCSGCDAYDHRLNNSLPCGPFTSESSFNDYLVAPVRHCPRPEWVKEYRDQMKDDHGICFTHADLDGEHVLVDSETGRVNGIIDWEMAGWWPRYWEYCKARYGVRYQR